MTIETIMLSGAKWLWEQYGKDIVDRAGAKFEKSWQEFEWIQAEQKYYSRLRDQYSTTRLLGYSKPIKIEGIYTDVYVLDSLSASRRYTIEQLVLNQGQGDAPAQANTRIPIVDLLQKTQLLFILGSPGAGKTTLLKYITMSACSQKIKKVPDHADQSNLSLGQRIESRKEKPKGGKKSEISTPVFISLKEWADSNKPFMDFLVEQFTICEFPDAGTFVGELLGKGDAIILCDGLDEVGQDNVQRDFINAINVLHRTYPECRIIITCRIAAVDYFFDQFTYVEIADFDKRQIQNFIGKWFQEDEEKLKQFMFEISKYENKGLLELARTPLLLALMCLAYEESLVFPRRRVELYKEALDALLRKWDATRGIKRDEIYHNLPPRRKEQLLSFVATENFVNQSIFIRKGVIIEQISKYLKRLPPVDTKLLPLDGEAVLKSIESQHGLLVERARDIFSFSHLTFQEYFVARYIVDNSGSGTIHDLFDYVDNPQWHEVFLLVASLLDDADIFFKSFLPAYSNLAQKYRDVKSMLMLGDRIASQIKDQKHIARTVGIFIALILFRRGLVQDAKVEDSECIRSFHYAIKVVYDILRRVIPIDRPYYFKIREVFAEANNVDVDSIMHPVKMGELLDMLKVKFSPSDLALRVHQIGDILRYFQTTVLLLDCLELSVVSDRQDVKAHIFT